LWPKYDKSFSEKIALKITGHDNAIIDFPFENSNQTIAQFVLTQFLETFTSPQYLGTYTLILRKYWEFYASLKLILTFESFVFIWLASELVRFGLYLYNRFFGKYNWKFMLLPDVLITFWESYPLMVAAEYYWRYTHIAAKLSNPYHWMT